MNVYERCGEGWRGRREATCEGGRDEAAEDVSTPWPHSRQEQAHQHRLSFPINNRSARGVHLTSSKLSLPLRLSVRCITTLTPPMAGPPVSLCLCPAGSSLAHYLKGIYSPSVPLSCSDISCVC
ncbi:hypothetical protein E2C01_020860 [Portunus trituberculatus]|uniref:Uncharacterized protein n=1 Tax=Portunus trituberculatus TaxID=210409 RepID=A0A5B7E116_PORTR|nr:hypothetical protein [Portunus trituberculatus]